MSLTTAQLRNRVMRKLGVLAAGEEPLAEESEDVDDAIAHLHEELVGQGVVTWDADEIPEQVALPLMWIVCDEVASDLAPDMKAEFERRRPKAEARLRAQTRHELNGEPVQAEYY